MAAVAVVLSLLVTPAGAVAVVYVVNTQADPAPDGSCGPPTCSLREAIALSTSPTVDSITLPAGHYVLSRGELQLMGDRINGAGARSTILDGNGGTRVLLVTEGNSIVNGVTIRGGNGTSLLPNGVNGIGGGALVQGGALGLNNSHVIGNTATADGGGIGIQGATRSR